MKTVFAKMKSEYLHCLDNCMDYNLSETFRKESIQRLHEIQMLVRGDDDEILLMVTSNKTNPMSKKHID